MRLREPLLYAIFGAGSLVPLGFMVYAGQPSSLAWFVEVAPFAAWALAPFAAGGIATHLLGDSPASLMALLVAGIALVLVSLAVLYQALVATCDAQGGLIFLSLPFFELLGLLPFLGAAVWFRKRAPA